MLALCPQLFLKEHLHQLLESMRERVLSLAALTLQRCLRGFLTQRRFCSLRRKIILLQSRARGYLARCSPGALQRGVGGLGPHLGSELPVPGGMQAERGSLCRKDEQILWMSFHATPWPW